MKPWSWKFHCFAGLALALFAGINPFCLSAATAQNSSSVCSTTSCSVPNLFDPDLAELKATKNKELNDALDWSRNQIKDGDNKNPGCYPPTKIYFTVFTKPSSDPELSDLIVKARVGSVNEYLKGAGIDDSRRVVEPATATTRIAQEPGADGTMAVSQYSQDDRDPPIIRTNSNPPKGTKVKEGQKITVRSTVSERYADGHKSWPTGVKSIQLIANGLLEEPAEDYGMKPPPCQVRTFERTYTVPANPPPVVKLRVYAEDAVGHGTFEEAEFPTGDWYGTLRGHGQGSQYNETAVVEFSFSQEADSTIKGRGHVTVTSEPQVSGDCVSQNTPPDPFDVSISGRHVGDEFQLELANPRKTIKMSSKCRSGSNTFSRSTSGFLGAGSQSFLQPKVGAKDGATNVLPQTPGFWPVDAKIELHQARKN